MAQLNLDVNLPSSSISYGKNNYNVFDVFINHRGPDVKKTLAKDIYNLLRKHGLRVFLDEDELQEGENLTPQIEGAIRTASVHVAIFSPRYAESWWCLKELVMMLESGSTILPVFYGVKPSELRWTQCENGLYAKVTCMFRWWLRLLHWTRAENGVYAQALLKLQEKKTFDSETQQEKPRYDPITIQNWRKALSVVAEISGFDLDSYNGDKMQLLEDVVEGVLKKVKRVLHVCKYPIGLDKKAEDFERTVLLKQQSGEVGVIGIVGPGGVGKTTLAKEIFNRQISNYSRYCCLLDVKEKPLITSQSTVLKVLAQFDEQIYSVDDGIVKLRRYLSSLHALVVLDDVDRVEQLDALLLPMKDVLQEGSLILVTSCNKDVLTNLDIADSSIYKLTGLDRQQSKELFCSHAFSQSHPIEGFDDVVEKVLDVSNGLPLSVTVLGGHLLRNNELSYWKAQLRKIAKIVPHDIQSRLKISYDSLDDEEKQIFLDIACFFIGENRDTAIRIWDGSGWEGSLGLRNLENRCVVEIDSDNCIRMHSHLRDLGRNIAEKEPPHRLWRPIENLLHNLLDQSAVRGIHMVEQRSGRRFENPVELDNRFRDMSKLELLRAEGDCLKSIFSRVQSTHIIWLRWHSCPYSCLPPWIKMKSLRVLEVKGGKLTTLWGDHNSEAPLQLRELNIIDAPLLKIPKSIGKLKHLEKIVLHDGYMETLPNEFCNLQCLKHLELKSCSEMKSLPDSFGNLTKLQHIDLSQCINLEMLPNSFGNLVQLQHLELKSCSEMKSLPDSLGKLTKLQYIDLSQCINLQMLPNSFGNLVNLEHLELKTCSEMMSLPNSIGSLTKLQYIELSECKKLRMLPCSFGNLVQLQHLYLDKCNMLAISKRDFGNIRALERLKISGCSRIEVLPPQVSSNQSLRELILRNTSLKKLPSDIGELIHLEVLILGSQLLTKLPASFGSLGSLQQLELLRSQLKRLPESIGNLRSLKQLRIQSLKRLECLPDSIGYLTSLEELVISNCSELKCLPDSIRLLTRLRELKIGQSGVDYLPPSVMELNNLERLEIEDCGLNEIPFRKDVGERTLTDSMSSKLDISNVKCMPGLKYLKLRAIRISEVLFREGVCPNLQYLNIKDCHCLVEVGPLPATLIELVLWNCVALRKIGLSGLAKLEGVEDSRSLKRLNVSGCPKLQWDGEVMKQLRQRLKRGLIL